ncbi:universal stress protein [Mycobacterium sp. CVI_P3]|uniref:Universal stress protein n=1 Tax=Mycobacterium pinniadriaticum TaxID=2994102 RepID=A0ABT3S8G1_9MYCO|nr:universal stress protein [Mycobacterium pinniadriaticum]MCX2929352.1 universal stress protein [Mycobacterium pinniadriaticum]MCX2935776.1 universal stress protein [Mycobacterium pinniadriaticum]
MRYVVGYGPRHRGLDAVNLAATLARSSGATLDLVSVLPSDAPTFHRYSPDDAFNAELEEQGREWLADGLAQVPVDVTAEGHLRRADSITEGLLDAATDPDQGEAALIVVGTFHRVRSGRFGLGSLADALLHASEVPVALAPTEYEPQARVTRITCAIGMRPGNENLVDNAIRLAAEWKVPLRLMSLIAVGEGGSDERRYEWTQLAHQHAAALVDKATAALGTGAVVTSVVGQGHSLEDAVQELDFQDSEIVLVGSSRLAQPKRLFLGHSASKIMRALAVPMIVWPRG